MTCVHCAGTGRTYGVRSAGNRPCAACRGTGRANVGPLLGNSTSGRLFHPLHVVLDGGRHHRVYPNHQHVARKRGSRMAPIMFIVGMFWGAALVGLTGWLKRSDAKRKARPPEDE